MKKKFFLTAWQDRMLDYMLPKVRIILVLILAVLGLANILSAAQPVFIRGILRSRGYSAFIPVDPDNGYWARVDFTSPTPAAYGDYFGIQQIMYGIVRPGKSINSMFHGGNAFDSGTTDGDGASKLIDVGQNFITTVRAGMVTWNTTDDTYAYVTAVDDDENLSLSTDIFDAADTYRIMYSKGWYEYAANGDPDPWTGNDNPTGYVGRGTATINEYALVDLVANCNRIHVTVYKDTDHGTISFSWDDDTTTGLLVTANYDLAAASDRIVDVIVLADTAAPAGAKLKILCDENNQVSILGVRSWNTNAVGDPSTLRHASNGTIGEGHNLVDFVPAYIAGTGFHGYDEVANYTDTYKIGDDGTSYEFAVKIATDGNAKKWVGGLTHYGAGTAEYTHDGYADGPELRIDGADTNPVNETFSNTIGDLHAGDVIGIFSDGYADYNEDNDNTGDNEPTMCLSWIITETGISFTASISFAAAYDVDSTYFYGPMLKIPAANYVGKIQVPPNDAVALPSGSAALEPGSKFTVCLDAVPDLKIHVEFLGGGKEVYVTGSTYKAYIRASPANLLGGTDPGAGDLWSIGSSWRFERFVPAKPIPRTRTRYSNLRYGVPDRDTLEKE